MFGTQRGAAQHRDGDDHGFEHQRAADPSEHRPARVAFRAGGKELLIHALVAQQQQQGRQQISEAMHPAERSEHGEVIGGQGGVYRGPAARAGDQQGQGNQRDHGDQQPDDQIQIRDRRHAGQRRKRDDERGDDVHAGLLLE